MMNILSRSVLALYAYDETPDDISVANVLRQCLQPVSYTHLDVYKRQGSAELDAVCETLFGDEFLKALDDLTRALYMT